jgi:hypothetical protein
VTPRKFLHNKLRDSIVGGNKEQVNGIFAIQRICETAANSRPDEGYHNGWRILFRLMVNSLYNPPSPVVSAHYYL